MGEDTAQRSEKIRHESTTAVYDVVYRQGVAGQMAQEKEDGKKGRNSSSNSSAEELSSIRKYSFQKQVGVTVFQDMEQFEKRPLFI